MIHGSLVHCSFIHSFHFSSFKGMLILMLCFVYVSDLMINEMKGLMMFL